MVPNESERKGLTELYVICKSRPRDSFIYLAFTSWIGESYTDDNPLSEWLIEDVIGPFAGREESFLVVDVTILDITYTTNYCEIGNFSDTNARPR